MIFKLLPWKFCFRIQKLNTKCSFFIFAFLLSESASHTSLYFLAKANRCPWLMEEKVMHVEMQRWRHANIKNISAIIIMFLRKGSYSISLYASFWCPARSECTHSGCTHGLTNLSRLVGTSSLHTESPKAKEPLSLTNQDIGSPLCIYSFIYCWREHGDFLDMQWLSPS